MSKIIYKGFDVTKSLTHGEWTVIDENGSGWVCESLDDAKDLIDRWAR